MRAPPDEKVSHDELSDEDLVLYYYGETRRRDKIRRRLEASPAAQARYDELCRALAAVETLPVPEPDAGYETRVWNRLRGELDAPRRESWWKRLGEAFTPPRLAAAGALAAMLALAFLAGRYWRFAEEELSEPVLLSAAGRERIMMSVVADHLERSERLLVELANAPGDGGLDVSFERAGAEALLGANRLYRQTSLHAGQAGLAAVLDELERLLLELARGPAELPAAELEELRARIDDVLFKVRVLSWRLGQQRQTVPQSAFAPPAGGDEI